MFLTRRTDALRKSLRLKLYDDCHKLPVSRGLQSLDLLQEQLIDVRFSQAFEETT